jgi:adenine-specific DNA methylase
MILQVQIEDSKISTPLLNKRLVLKPEEKEFNTIKRLSKPLQYLGAKNRVINSIINESSKHIYQGYVLDLFSGSSIVSQAFSNNGIKVISNDVQKFSGIISNTFLKIDFDIKDLDISPEILFKNDIFDEEFFQIYKYYIEQEELFLNDKNTNDLLKLYENFPLLWNDVKSKTLKINEIISKLALHINEPAFDIAPLFTTLYAGTYFGILQSIKIDIFRNRIEDLARANKISTWQYNLFLTSLISVISKIVNSAGKHFAQPIKFENIIKNELLESRLFKNRLIDIDTLLSETISQNLDKIKTNITPTSNLVLSMSMESIIQKTDKLPSIDLIYADPPYTAQQYSRFYHIPEILIDYKVPELQIHRGKTTTGIYPENKFKSRFCSVSKAPDAFTDLFNLTKKTDSTLVLSYSESKSNETGNKRMITLNKLRILKEKIIPNYTMQIIELDLKYKQHNNQDSVIKKNEDSEVLIIFSKVKNNI